MAQFEVQFDLRGSMMVDAENYSNAEKMAKNKLEQYKESMKVHFQKEMDLKIDDVEKVS